MRNFRSYQLASFHIFKGQSCETRQDMFISFQIELIWKAIVFRIKFYAQLHTRYHSFFISQLPGASPVNFRSPGVWQAKWRSLVWQGLEYVFAERSNQTNTTFLSSLNKQFCSTSKGTSPVMWTLWRRRPSSRRRRWSSCTGPSRQSAPTGSSTRRRSRDCVMRRSGAWK